MKANWSMLIVLTILIVFRCESLFNSKEHPDNGRIDWPALLDSPWPIWGGDPLNTYRAIYAGPSAITDTAWLFRIPSGTGILECGLLIGDDDTIFATISFDKSVNPTSSVGDGILYKLDRNGGTIWKTIVTNGKESPEVMVTPVLLSDGSIISAAFDKSLTRVSADGSILWHLSAVATAGPPGLLVDQNGNIFIADLFDNNYIKCFSLTGGLLHLVPHSFNWGIGPFLQDGRHLLASSSDSIYCLDLAGNVKWQYNYKTKRNLNSFNDIKINNYGEIFCFNYLDTSLVCLNSAGTVKWKKPLSSYGNFNTFIPNIAVDMDDNLIFGVVDVYREGDSDYAAVVSIDRKGKLRWLCYLDNQVDFYTLIIDAEGKAYCVDGKKIYFISPTGIVLGTQNYENPAWAFTKTMNLAINSRGELLVCLPDGVLRVR